MTCVLIKRIFGDTQKEEGHGKTEAEIEAMHLQAKDPQGLLANYQDLEETRKDSSLESSERAGLCQQI